MTLPEDASSRARYATAGCRQRAYRARAGHTSTEAGTEEVSWCAYCGDSIFWLRSRAGQTKIYCNSACSQGAYRQRLKDRAAQEEAAREERRRKRRQAREEARNHRASSGSSSSGGDSWSGQGTGGGGYSYSYVDPTVTARETVFRLARLLDDGSTTLKRAYRAAAKLLHPDINSGDGETFKKLERAAAVLRSAGLL